MDFDILNLDGTPTGETFTMPKPIGRGSKVRYRGGETHQTHGATAGIYTVHSTDEYYMCGYIELEDALGRVFPIDASLIEAVPDHELPAKDPTPASTTDG